MTGRAAVDRAEAVRAAMRTLVAQQGLHGTSMAAVATLAGVAAGTAYVHYASKEELLLAAYVEAKADLGRASMRGVDLDAGPHERFVAMWMSIHRYVSARPELACFLIQVDGSPLAALAHQRSSAADDDPLVVQAATADMRQVLAPLPAMVLYELGLAPAIRLVASGHRLTVAQRRAVAEACWRAVTGPVGSASATRPNS